MRVREGCGGVGGGATACRRRAVSARGRDRRRRRRRRRQRRWRRGRRRGRLAGALAVDHVLDIYKATQVSTLVHGRRRCRHERVRAIRARRQRHHLGTLEEVPNPHCGRRPTSCQRAAPAVHLVAIGRRVQDELVGLVVIRVVHQHGEVALPLHRRQGRRRRLRGRRYQGRGRWGRRGSRRRG